MIIAIQGTKNFDDYQVFLRAMRVALSELPEEDKSILILSAGPANVNSMGMEFTNISERSLRARGIRIQLRKVPPSIIDARLYEVDYFAFFCLKKEPTSRLFQEAEAKGVESHIYQFR
jgi:hypothetical protein